MFNLTNLYRLTKNDVKKARGVYARAFATNSIWEKVIEDIENKSQALQAFFEVAIRYSIKYGFPYATSQQLEGISIWLPHDRADITAWGMIRSGGLRSISKIIGLGIKVGRSLESFSQIDKDRREIMAGRPYLYLNALAVDPEYQRKGIASNLLKSMFDKTDSCGYSIFLTSEIENLEFYKKLGFSVIKEISISFKKYEMIQWHMVRSPKK